MNIAFINTKPARWGWGLALSLLVTLAILAGMTIRADAQTSEPTFTVEPLTPLTAYPDDLSATIKMRLEGGQGMKVIHVRDFDHVLFTRITFEDGAVVDWHTHPGPVVVSVAEGSLTITNAGECVARDYDAGQGFLDPGHGNVHNAKANGPTIVYATFFEVPENGQATVFAAEPACEEQSQSSGQSIPMIPRAPVLFLEQNLNLPGDVALESTMVELQQSYQDRALLDAS